MRYGMIVRWMVVSVSVFAAQAALPGGASAQETNWKCTDPNVPFRFADSVERRNAQTPEPCREWLAIRGNNLEAMVALFGVDRFEAANRFLEVAASAGGLEYPKLDLFPITTRSLYDDPAKFGFRVLEGEDAPTGSWVLYDGLGGILVEVRDPADDEWRKQVLYPSAARDFNLWVTDLEILGKLEAKVLAPM